MVTARARLTVLLIATASMASLGAAAAQADLAVSVGWQPPSTMTAGGTATQDITVTNRSDAGETVTLSPIWFVPSCGTTDISPCETPDLGVFSIDSPAVGLAGMCNEDAFPAVADDTMPTPTGRIALNPSPALMLTAAPTDPGNFPFGEACTIRLSYQVLRVPTYDSDPGMAGVQTRQAFQYTLNGGGTSSHANQVTVNPGAAAPILDPAPTVIPLAKKKCKKGQKLKKARCVKKKKKK